MPSSPSYLPIGQVAARCGVAASALRFYEQKGLIQSQRGVGGQRRFHRAMIRKIAIIRVAQGLGISLAEIKQEFDTLPDDRAPTLRDWRAFSSRWRVRLDRRIQTLEQLRDQLDSCIGCGCLSINRCSLYNKNDQAGADGSGARFLGSDIVDATG